MENKIYFPPSVGKLRAVWLTRRGIHECKFRKMKREYKCISSHAISVPWSRFTLQSLAE